MALATVRRLEARVDWDPGSLIPAPERRRHGLAYIARNLGSKGVYIADRRPYDETMSRRRWLTLILRSFRLTQYPSHLWFELTMLPHNMPLPEPKALGRAVGVLCHVLTIFTGYMAAPIKADFNSFGDDWSDMHGEMRGGIPEGFAEEDSGFGLVSD